MPDTQDEQSPTTPTSVVGQLRSLWDKMSPKRRAIIVLAMVGTVVFMGAMSLGGSVESYTPLYTGMSAEESGEVIAILKEKGAAYKISNAGTAVEVLDDKVHELRMELAASGYPRGGGIGFEIFDKQTFGTTSFVEQVNYRRALQGEITRSITAISAIKSARVHLAMGKRSVFRDSDEPPSASVALRIKPGRSLSAEEVRGVVYLVASSVDGLEAGQVVVIDERGRVLSATDSESADSRVSEVQNKIESSLEKRVRRMVETVVGVGNAAVVVTAEMDFSRVDTTEEMYDKDKIAIRSEVRNATGKPGAGLVGGIAGARANLDGGGATTTAGDASSSLSETRNYEVPRTLTRTIGPSSTISRLHVAVLVNYKEDDTKPEPVAEPAVADGTTAEGEEAKPGDQEEAPKEGEEAQEPVKVEEPVDTKPERIVRTAEELAIISAIAKEAAGLNDDRGDSLVVQNVLFEEVEEDPIETELFAKPLFSRNMFYAGAAVLGLLLTVILLFMMRTKKGETLKHSNAEVVSLPAPIGTVQRALESGQVPGQQPELPAAAEEDQGSLNGDLYERVVSTVRTDAGHAARVLSALLDDTSKGKA